MFGLFRRQPKKGPSFLVLDIGTEVVKALICVHEANKAAILGVGRKKQNLGDMDGGVVLDIGGVIENCKVAIAMAEKEAEVLPDQLVMGIAGELVKGKSSVTSYVRPEPETKIDLAELKNIVHKVEWKAFEQVRSELAYETGYNEIDVKLVNAAITDVRIDGYRVSNPIGFQGREVTVTIFNVFAPLVHFGALQTIAAELELDLISITAEPYALARSLLTGEENNMSAIFIDVGGGTTDIAVVRNGVVEGTKMFTLGGRTFTKRLASSLNISFQDAEEIKLAFSAGKLEKHSEKIVREAIESDAEVWLSGVALTLSEFYHVDSFPSQIYLCGGGSLLPQIKKNLESDQFASLVAFPKKPVVTYFQPKLIKEVIDGTRKLSNPQDVTPMALASFALEVAGEEPVSTKILKKVVKLMQV